MLMSCCRSGGSSIVKLAGLRGKWGLIKVRYGEKPANFVYPYTSIYILFELFKLYYGSPRVVMMNSEWERIEMENGRNYKVQTLMLDIISTH